MKVWLSKRQWQFSSNEAFQNRFAAWTAALSNDFPQVKAFQLFVESQIGGSRKQYRSEMEQQLAADDLAAAPPIHPLLRELPTIDALDFHPVEVARQMTLMESSMLKAIEAQEWMGQGWMKKDGRAPNLVAFIDRFNAVSNWVSTIVVSGETIEARCAAIRYFTIVASECLALNNFNGCLEVISGLDCAPLTRMIQTWTALSPSVKKQFDSLREHVTIDNNYKRLRELVYSVTGPAIPYLGMYMGDLMYIEEGNATIASDDLYNYEKLEMVAKIIIAFEQFKLQRYSLAPQPLIMAYLKRPHSLNEDDLFALSLARESREENNALKAKLEKS